MATDLSEVAASMAPASAGRVRWLGTGVDYREAWELQRRIAEERAEARSPDTLLLLEHAAVYTAGRRSPREHVRGPLSAPLVETDRGGQVTYHGPGQLVGYPIVKLEPGRRDIRRFVADLEEVLLRTLATFGIKGHRDEVHRGVWVEDRKIASVGIRIARWVTSHGFALNVNTDLSYFSLIHPCGITGCQMTSISNEVGSAVDMRDVKERFVDNFAAIFDREPVFAPAEMKVKANG